MGRRYPAVILTTTTRSLAWWRTLFKVLLLFLFCLLFLLSLSRCPELLCFIIFYYTWEGAWFLQRRQRRRRRHPSIIAKQKNQFKRLILCTRRTTTKLIPFSVVEGCERICNNNQRSSAEIKNKMEVCLGGWGIFNKLVLRLPPGALGRYVKRATWE